MRSTGIGAMVCTPGPGMLNVMVSAPALALALRIACRNEPAPESFAFVTVKTVAEEMEAEIAKANIPTLIEPFITYLGSA